MSKNDTLTVKQWKAIAALLAEPSVIAAAKRAGISRKTLYRYLADPAFRAALEAAQDEALQMLSGQLVTFLGMGLAALARALQSEDSRIAVQAAAVVLRHFVELRQHCALEQRVSALEQKASEVKKWQILGNGSRTWNVSEGNGLSSWFGVSTRRMKK